MLKERLLRLFAPAPETADVAAAAMTFLYCAGFAALLAGLLSANGAEREPTEFAVYAAVLLSLPPTAAFAVFAARALPRLSAILAILAPIAVWCGFFLLTPLSYFSASYSPQFLAPPLYFALTALGAFACFAALRMGKIRKIFCSLAAILLGIPGLFFCALYLNELLFPLKHYNYAYHYSAVVHAMLMAENGFLPGLDFDVQYGFYAVFLAPVLRFCHPGFHGMNNIFALLILAAFSLFGVLLWHMVQKKLAAAAAFSALAATPVLLGQPDIYLQYWPLRTLFPAAVLTSAFFAMRSGSKKLRLTTSALASASIFWNADSGMVLLLAWWIFLVYDIVFSDAALSAKWLASAKTAARELGVFVAVFGAFCLWSAVFFGGGIPDFRHFFDYIAGFAESGAIALPMPKAGMWLIAAAVYAGAIVFAFGRGFAAKRTLHSDFSFLLGILGLGLFSYYVGRSHDYNLFLVCFPGVLLLALCADAALTRQGRTTAAQTLLGTAALFILFSCAAKPLNSLSLTFRQHRPHAVHDARVDEMCSQMKSMGNACGGRAVLFCDGGALLMLKSGLRPAFAYTGAEEIIRPGQANQIWRRLSEDSTLTGVAVVQKGLHTRTPEGEKLVERFENQLGHAVPDGSLMTFRLPIADGTRR